MIPKKLEYYLHRLFGGRVNYSNATSFYKKALPWEDFTYVGIVSTGRTGTKFLGNIFDRYVSNSFSCHEPFLETIPLSCDYLLNKIDDDHSLSMFKKHRRSLLTKLNSGNKNLLLESDGNLCYLVPLIQKYIPNYKIIHVIRDPKDFVRSFASRVIRIKGKEIVRYESDEYWKILPKQINDPVMRLWQEYSIIEKGAWQWAHINSYVLEAIENDKNALTLRYEDIFNANELSNGIGKMFEFLGYEIDEAEVSRELSKPSNSTKNFKIGTFEQWSAIKQDQFHNIVYPIASKYDYLS